MQKIYTVAEAAALFGVHQLTIRCWIRDGKLKATKNPGGKVWMISAEDVAVAIPDKQ